ncbi:MAG: hypothetical protein ACW986_05570 [Promethearchaeota archaeon]|jgi:hypothetical protein
MNENKRIKAKMFRFKLNDTSTAILFFFSFTMIIGLISLLYYRSWIFFNTIRSITFSDLLTMGFQFLIFLVTFSVTWISGGLLFYVLIICLLNRKSVGNYEGVKIKWFGFRLNKTSLVVIFILSLASIMSVIFILFNSIGFLMTYFIFSYLPSYIIIQQILSLISSLILISFYIYSLAVCGKNCKRIEENDTI